MVFWGITGSYQAKADHPQKRRATRYFKFGINLRNKQAFRDQKAE